MIPNYSNFFIASSGASAAFIGLLFVGMSIVNSDDANYGTRERRIVLAASAFLALIDVFFVSLISCGGGTRTFATANLIIAAIGAAATARLIQRAASAGSFRRGFPTQRLNIVFATSSVCLYAAQLLLAVLLLFNQSDNDIVRLSLLVLMGLYASALSRAWEITGISHRKDDPALPGAVT